MGKKNQGVVKGAPSGLVISLLVHAVAGLLAVFDKPEKKFVPPKPVERPDMKLRKPKVKKTAKVKRTSMPDIQLPEMGAWVGIEEQLLDLNRDPGETKHFTDHPEYASRLKRLRAIFETEWFPGF